MNQSVEKKMDELIGQIEFHRLKYYRDNDPQITDREYDLMEKELAELEAVHPDLVRPDSPSFRVGAGIADDHPLREHRRPMLSLENSYSLEELNAFFTRTQKAAGQELSYAAELKIDGLSLSVVYERGVLARAITRGDGKVGEDVTLNAKTIRELPLRVKAWQDFEEMEVRGEVYLDKRTFAAINERRLDAGLPLFANPRNAAAGSLRMMDSRKTAERGLRLFTYHVLGPWSEGFGSHFKSLEELGASGFPTNPHNTLVRGIGELRDLVGRWDELRATLNYDTDGVVIKVDDPAFHERIGYTAKFPKWATAYKFASEQARSKILSIEVQVGRTGVLTPVANFEPVALAGTTVSRATLHNFDEIRKKDIRVGDHVFIEKGGDIIPKVVKVLLDQRTGEEEAYAPPENCPRCGTAAEQEEDQVALRCVNLACPAQLERRITHFSGRNAMDIQGLGKERVQQMVAAGLLTDLADIYRLNPDKLWKLERVGGKWISNLLGEIGKSKSKPFSRLLFAVGIPMVGEKAAEQLVDTFGSYERLTGATTEEIAAIHGLGEKVGEAVTHHLALESYRKTFADFAALGLTLAGEVKTSEDEGDKPFAGKTVVITGTFSIGTRTELTRMMKELGANVTSSVTGKTDYLLAGEKAGSKLAKAEKLQVTVVDEEQVKEWLNL